MKQIYIKKNMARSSAKQLVRADVLSEHNGIIRCMLEGALKPIEVKASDTMPVTAVMGARPDQDGAMLQRSYSPARNALANVHAR